MAVVYEMENVYQKYKGEKSYANKNISLDIKNNQIVGFFGENGVGKSTLVDAMVGYRAIDKY